MDAFVWAGGWANGGAQAVSGLDVSCTMSDLENLADLSDLDEQSTPQLGAAPETGSVQTEREGEEVDAEPEALK